MNLREALDQPEGWLTAELTAVGGAPALRAVLVDAEGLPDGRYVALYSSAEPEGELLGAVPWAQAVVELAAAAGVAFLAGAADGVDGIAGSVGGADAAWRGALVAEESELTDRRTKVRGKIAELDA